jgi:hypothetical protein
MFPFYNNYFGVHGGHGCMYRQIRRTSEDIIIIRRKQSKPIFPDKNKSRAYPSRAATSLVVTLLPSVSSRREGDITIKWRVKKIYSRWMLGFFPFLPRPGPLFKHSVSQHCTVL